ncbi:MAG TPA: murein L,D-transpeptidase catalytic domain family protein [Myxococcota bacterium]
MTRSRRLACLVLMLLLAPALANGAEPVAGTGLRTVVLERALAAFARLESAGRVRNRLLTVIDYTLPSSQRRLWVLEPGSMQILFHEFVAHGKGSSPDEDPDRAVRFGNQLGSYRSSLGTFLTGDAYSGEHGYSLRLEGLDPGVNDRAAERAIVIHPADYVTAAFRTRSGGRLGRSWGCPALDPAVAPAIIDRIQAGSVLYATGPGS